MNESARSRRIAALFTLGAAAALGGCASTYGNLTSANNLGAAEYQPAVLVPPGREAQYAAILDACRRAAFNRQVTAAHEAQQGALTGALQGAASGATMGYTLSNAFKSAGYDASTTRGALAGGALGIVGSLADAFGRGARDTSAQTRSALLTCLRSKSAEIGYTVLE